jgi:uncharacterized damage-inducible protein DinB
MRATDLVLSLLDYSYWGRDRILDAAASLTKQQYTQAAGLDHDSISKTLAHTLAAEALWRLRLGGVGDALLPEIDAATPDALRVMWQAEERALGLLLKRVTDTTLDRPVEYVTSQGSRRSEPVWQVLVQLVNHGTQHRSEVALVLTRLGHSPGFLDFIVFAREREATRG